ncbi:hypothetical protein BZL33_25320 [Escherichia coli]|nr:hypothetical protein BZL33_25320 [Escherichia coli]
MTKNTRFSPEVRQRAIRMVLESQGEYDSQWAAICSIAPKIGCTPETLRVWVRQHERDTGGGDGYPSPGFRLFCEGGVRPPLEKVMPLLDKLRKLYGVGPVCSELA